MSNKSNKKSNSIIVNKNTMYPVDKTLNSPNVNDITKNFDCLKISILNKASKVSGEFGKVTLGPDADHGNSHISDIVDEVETKTDRPPLNGTLSARTNITFSIKKILLENEIQRREKVKKVVEQKKKEMELSQKELQENLSHLLSKMCIQREKETAEKLARLEAEEEQIEIDKKNEMYRQKLEESEEIMRKIIPYRESFQKRWKDIANISSNCRDKTSGSRLLTPHIGRLKDLNMHMESISEKAKSGDVSTADIKLAEFIVQCSDDVFLEFKDEIDKVNALYDKEIARREMEVKRAEIAAQEEALKIKQMQDQENAAKVQEQLLAQAQQQEVIQKTQSYYSQNQPFSQNQQVSEVDNPNIESQPPQYPNTNAPELGTTSNNQVPIGDQPEQSYEYLDHESLKLYIDSHEFLESYTASYQDFIKSDTMKKFKLECQKTLNTAINSISHVSAEQLIDKYEKLRLFLSGKGNPNILSCPQAEAYSKSLLAQKIVDQGDTTISSKSELAFPFAAITVALWNDWLDFGEILLARFRTKSLFFVPVFLAQRNDQSDEDYLKSLGYKFNEDGTVEKLEYYLKRLEGYMYLYASILITRQRRGLSKPHPHGIGNAWRWLAATINIEPRPDIADACASLIYVMLKVTGSDLWKTYPTQFPKMLLMLNNVYYEKMKNLNSVISPSIRLLGDFLTDAIQKRSIPPPKGQLPPNFW